jgi:hypothetical protein
MFVGDERLLFVLNTQSGHGVLRSADLESIALTVAARCFRS